MSLFIVLIALNVDVAHMNNHTIISMDLVCKPVSLDQLQLIIKFDSYWMFHTFIVVPQLLENSLL